jgi:DNA-binding IclR family transcriptional regulator
MDGASVHRYLKTLEEGGFIERNPKTRRYRLGLALVELAGVRLSETRLVDVAKPHLAWLSRETGETVQLSILDGDNVFYLDILESPQPIRVASKVGDRAPLHCTAAGKLFFAFLDDGRREELLSRTLYAETPNTITDPDELRVELAEIRRREISVDNEGFIAHLRAVAAPVRDASGTVVAAVAIGGPTQRVSVQMLDPFSTCLRAATRGISRDLGYVERGDHAGREAGPASIEVAPV